MTKVMLLMTMLALLIMAINAAPTVLVNQNDDSIDPDKRLVDCLFQFSNFNKFSISELELWEKILNDPELDQLVSYFQIICKLKPKLCRTVKTKCISGVPSANCKNHNKNGEDLNDNNDDYDDNDFHNPGR